MKGKFLQVSIIQVSLCLSWGICSQPLDKVRQAFLTAIH
jgi:hypothetical protein